MAAELIELLRRERDAVEAVEARLRALELTVGGGQDRFLGFAVDEVETASDRLSSLELTRSLGLSAAGWSGDVRASELVGAVDDPEVRDRLEQAVEALKVAVVRLEDARERARNAVLEAKTMSRARLDAAQALTAPSAASS